jgi:hypothetical protein
LRPAPGETGASTAVPFFGWHQSNWVLHTSNSSKWGVVLSRDPQEP